MAALSKWVAADGTELMLDGTTGVSVSRGVEGLDGPPIRNTLDPRLSDGAVLVNSRRPERPFTLPLLINESVITAGTVIALLQGPGTLTSTSGRSLRSVIYDQGLEGRWTIDEGGVIGLTHRKFAVSFLATDPWWYGPAQSQSGTFGTATAWNAAIAWNASIPWDGGSATAIVNSGDAATPVVVVLKGAATTVSMSVNGVGGWVTAQTLLTNAYLSVSGENGRLGPHRGPHGQFAGVDGPVDWSLLSEGSQLFELPAGSSSLVLGATGTDGNTQWNLFWSPRYLTS